MFCNASFDPFSIFVCLEEGGRNEALFFQVVDHWLNILPSYKWSVSYTSFLGLIHFLVLYLYYFNYYGFMYIGQIHLIIFQF